MTSGGSSGNTELEELKAQLLRQNERISQLTERPFKPDLPAALTILHGAPGAEEQFRYWKRALNMVLRPLTAATDDELDKLKFPFLFRALSPAVHATIEEAIESELFSTCMTTLETLYVKA